MQYFYILFISFSLFSCTSIPKGYLNDDINCNYDDPIFYVSKDELLIDSGTSVILKENNGDYTLLDNSNYKSRFVMLSNDDIINYKTNKNIGIEKWLLYRKNRTIKSSQIKINGNDNLFKEIHYDKQGNITKVIDFEKGYRICYSEAIEIVKKVSKKDIEEYQIEKFHLTHQDLNKFPNQKPKWTVSYKVKEKDQPIISKYYIIDGVTGKIIKTYKRKNI